jgi:hypothetical protein
MQAEEARRFGPWVLELFEFKSTTAADPKKKRGIAKR